MSLDNLELWLYLVSLNINDNWHITDVSFMTNLRKLNIGGSVCGVGPYGIRGLNLKKLNTNGNNKFLGS